MQLSFERWIEIQSISIEAKSLLREAVVCYKSSAYRASFLFSYLGFITVLRDRILRAERPEEISQEWWTGSQLRLRNDDKWDPEVFDATQRASKTVFDLTDDLRTQVKFYKDRRNDCAHGKSNKITLSHTEAIWTFLESNLPKFVVRGSRGSMTNRISDFYDRSITPAGTSVMPIVSDIPQTIEDNNIKEFLQSVPEIIEGSEVTLWSFAPDTLDFLNAIFDLDHSPSADALIEILEETDGLTQALLERHPQRLIYLYGKPAIIRKIWYNMIPGGDDKDMDLFCKLLKHNLIPAGELEEAVSRIVENLPSGVPDQDSVPLLESAGFYAQIRKKAFVDHKIDKFSWGNPHASLVIHYLDTHDIDLEVATSITQAFSGTYYATSLKSKLDNYISDNPGFKDQLDRFIASHQLPEPHKLKAWEDEALGSSV